jgi:hypothetical protein
MASKKGNSEGESIAVDGIQVLAEIQERLDGVMAAAPQAPTAQTRTAPEWAEAKGMAPQFIAGGSVPVPNPAYWKYAGVKARWSERDLITEAEFDAAVQAAMTHILR